MTMRMSEYQFWSRVIRIGAAVVGATLALWLLSGDRDPEAASLSDSYTQTVTILAHGAVASPDLGYFEFRVFTGPYADQIGAAWVCSGDNDLNITKWLTAHDRERVVWSLSAATPLHKDSNAK